MKQAIRHNRIIELVKLHGYISTEELVSELDVSPQTIRRDLNELAAQNQIRRHHGGAASPSSSENSDYASRKTLLSQEKDWVAKCVAQHIPNGSSLFIDIGTTAEAVARALLNHENLRIVTNNLNAAHILMEKENFQIIIAGGGLRPDGGIIGEATMQFIAQFRLDFGILGISAIDRDGSLLDYDYHEVQVKRTIIESSRTSILVTDHSKFSRNAMVRLGAITMFDYLFTDKTLPNEVAKVVENSSLVVEVCPRPE